MTGQTLIAEAGLPAELQEVLHDLRLRDSLKEAASESDYDCACLDFSCSFFFFRNIRRHGLKTRGCLLPVLNKRKMDFAYSFCFIAKAMNEVCIWNYLDIYCF